MYKVEGESQKGLVQFYFKPFNASELTFNSEGEGVIYTYISPPPAE